MDSTKEKQKDSPSEDEVARYLRNHPGFFLKHEDLLADITLSHDSGKAVSLLERQVSILRDRNMEMRTRLNGLLENAQHNDILFEKTKSLILSILEARRADEMADTFCRTLTENFDVDAASLIVFGNPGVSNTRLRVTSPDEAGKHIGSLLRNNKAICGVLRENENHFLFAEQLRGRARSCRTPNDVNRPNLARTMRRNPGGHD